MSGPKCGIRSMHDVDLIDAGGVLVHLEPAGADLDAVLLEVESRFAVDWGYFDDDDPCCHVSAKERVQVGWFRRFPWCNCGEGHGWHFDEADEGARGAFLGVLVA